MYMVCGRGAWVVCMWCGSGVYGGGRRYVSLSVAQFAFFYVHVFCVFLCVSERLMPPDALTSHHHRPSDEDAKKSKFINPHQH